MADYKQIGKITGVRFGFGGFDDAAFGLSLTFGGPAWGVGTFEGPWASPPGKDAKWTSADQDASFAKAVRLLLETVKAAKVKELNDLLNVPVEVTFEQSGRLKSWRVLTEAL